jgi:multidrug efflux pump subunit AcrA (membrane-fusion protein)
MRANAAEQALATERAQRADAEARAAAAQRTADERAAALVATQTDADLRVAAIKAGIVDLDALGLVDRSALKVGPDGKLVDPDAVMAELKAAKPYLFGAPGTTPPPRSNTNPTPPPEPTAKPKRAIDMTRDEYQAAVKAHAWRK